MKTRTFLFIALCTIAVHALFLISGASLGASIPTPTPTRTQDILGSSQIIAEKCALIAVDEFTAIHEVGHCIDYWYGNISETKEFQDAVENYIKQNRKPESECVGIRNKEDIICELQIFPGIAGNLMHTNDDPGLAPVGVWGGYDEVYAEIYALWHYYYDLPEELRYFYHYLYLIKK